MASKQETLALLNDAAKSVDEILSLYEKYGSKLDASFGWVTQYVTDFGRVRADAQGKPSSWGFNELQSTAQLYAEKAPSVLASFKKALVARKLMSGGSIDWMVVGPIALVGLGAFYFFVTKPALERNARIFER